MSKYVVSYDVDDAENHKDTYVKVGSFLKRLGGFRVTLNVWLIESDKSSDELISLIKNYIRVEDTIFAVKISEDPRFYNQKDFDD